MRHPRIAEPAFSICQGCPAVLDGRMAPTMPFGKVGAWPTDYIVPCRRLPGALINDRARSATRRPHLSAVRGAHPSCGGLGRQSRPNPTGPQRRTFESTKVGRADDGVPVAISLLLILGADLEREGFVVLESGTAIEGDAGYSGDREFDRQTSPLCRAGSHRGTVDGTYRAVWRNLGIEAGSSLRVLVVPEADRILVFASPLP
jgi:hypothetical protein